MKQSEGPSGIAKKRSLSQFRRRFLVPLPLLKFVWERALVHVSNALNQVECKVNYWKRH